MAYFTNDALKFLTELTKIEARPNRSSLSRIYRDKGAPALYMHFEPKAVFVGGGIWQPSTTTLTKIRAAAVSSDKLIGEVVAGFKQVMPFMTFLSKAVGAPL